MNEKKPVVNYHLKCEIYRLNTNYKTRVREFNQDLIVLNYEQKYKGAGKKGQAEK